MRVLGFFDSLDGSVRFLIQADLIKPFLNGCQFQLGFSSPYTLNHPGAAFW
jgi:hypothetical protein